MFGEENRLYSIKAKTVPDKVKKTRKTLFMATARGEKGQTQSEISSTETKGWRILRDGVGAICLLIGFTEGQ